MGFSIPNDVPGGTTEQHAQATPDKVDIDILVAGHNLTGVQSGCAVTAQGSPNMTVAVALGTVGIAGIAAAVVAGNVTITTADATNPRFDLVVVNSSGTQSVTAGTPAALPVFPAIPANSAVLAAVYVGAGVTSIATADIVDKRVILNSTTYEPIMASGLLAAKPAAATFGKGFYFATDDAGGTLYHSDASAWTQVDKRGELGYAQITSDATLAVNSNADIAGLTITVTVGTRPILLQAYGIFQGTTAGVTQCALTINEGATMLTQMVTTTPAANAFGSAFCQARVAPSAGSHTYKCQGGVSAAQTGKLKAAATFPAYIQAIEL